MEKGQGFWWLLEHGNAIIGPATRGPADDRGGVVCLLWGALYPSKSGLMNKHIVKHIVICDAGGHTRSTIIASTRGPVHPEAQRLLHYFIPRATTRQHMHYCTTELKYENVMARNIQRFNALPSAAICPGITDRARGLARVELTSARALLNHCPKPGWRMQDEITAAMDGPIDHVHFMFRR
jgi:hypothetical protein